MEEAPALLLPIKLTVPLLLILAASAVLLSWNVRLPVRMPAIPVVKVALPALLVLANTRLDVGAKKKLGELEELLIIPAPVNSRLPAKGTLNEYPEAPGLNVNPPMVVGTKNVSPVIVDGGSKLSRNPSQSRLPTCGMRTPNEINEITLRAGFRARLTAPAHAWRRCRRVFGRSPSCAWSLPTKYC